MPEMKAASGCLSLVPAKSFCRDAVFSLIKLKVESEELPCSLGAATSQYWMPCSGVAILSLVPVSTALRVRRDGGVTRLGDGRHSEDRDRHSGSHKSDPRQPNSHQAKECHCRIHENIAAAAAGAADVFHLAEMFDE